MIAALFSGGKDSTLAIHKAAESGHKTELLITMDSENPDSYMFHKPNIRFTALQAQAMGIRHKIHITKGEKELELADLESALKDNGVTELITGAIASRYQKDRIDAICKRLGISGIAPLWGMDPLAEIQEVSMKFIAIITKVSAEGLDKSFLGKEINGALIEKLERANKSYGINMAFEGGEAESFVLDAPMFSRRINIKSADISWNGITGEYIIKDAELVEK